MDIVVRLRKDRGAGAHHWNDCLEAADEIIALRRALEAMVGYTETKVAAGLVDRAPELEPVREYLRRK